MTTNMFASLINRFNQFNRIKLPYIGFAVVYVLLLLLGLHVLSTTSQIAIIWPAGGFLMGCLVITPRQRWPWLFLLVYGLTILVEELSWRNQPLWLIVSLVSLNCLEAGVGALLIRRFCGGTTGFQVVRQVMMFMLGVVLGLPLLTAFIAALAIVPVVSAALFGNTYFTWAAAFSLGVLFTTPGVLALAHQWPQRYQVSTQQRLELALILGLAIALAWLQFGNETSAFPPRITLVLRLVLHPYTTLPLLLWAGMRFGQLGVTTAGWVWVIASVQYLHHNQSAINLDTLTGLHEFQWLVLIIAFAAIGFTVIYHQAQVATRRSLRAEALAYTQAGLAATAAARFEGVFNTVETGLILEDVSTIFQALHRLRDDGVTDLRAYLTQHPQYLCELIRQIDVLAVNQTALRLFQVDNLAAYQATLMQQQQTDTLAIFVDGLCAFWSKQAAFSSEVRYQTVNGKDIFAMVSFPIPSSLDAARQLLVSVLDITPLKQVEAALRHSQAELSLQVKRAEALLNLPQAADQLDEANFMQHGLELAEDLTNSEISFIHFINDDEVTIELVTWSRRTLAHYCSAIFDRHYPVHQAGIWADALRQRQPVIVNNYAACPHKQGLPEGHAHLQRLVSLPVLENGRVVMIAGVGNKTADYTDIDVETLQLIANDIWRLVQRRRAIKSLATSEQRLREAQHLANIGSWEFDHHTGELTWSDEVFHIFEVPREQFSYSFESAMQWVHPEDQTMVIQAFNAAIAQQTTYNQVNRLLTPTGKIKYIHGRGETYYADNRKPKRSVGTVQDITDQVLASRKLQQAAAVFRSTLEGVVITDLEGQILNVNQAFETITGYTQAEVIGQTPRLLKSGKHEPQFYANLWQALNQQGQWHGEIWNRRKDGTIYPELLTITTVRSMDDIATGYVGVFSDITEAKASQEQLDFLAYHNPLTELPNRLLFNDRLNHSIALASRQNTMLAVIFIDLDRFKHINDTMGHGAGDQLLQQLAARLKQQMRRDDTIAHLSGDEFVVLLENLDSAQPVTTVVHNLFETFKQPFQLQNQAIYITASLGISLFPNDGEDSATLLRNADTAMYQAKEEGRNTYRFYTQAMMAITFEQMLLENALRHALDRQEFHLVYQPQVALPSGRLVGLEALIRWHHKELGMISPAQFIPLAEETGLIRDIGAWVLHQACQQGQAWRQQGFAFGRIAVNVAGPQLRHGGLLTVLKTTLAATGFSPNHLELEVTEGFIMERGTGSIEQLTELRNLGIEISIDDFGTGYSSLSYLKKLPIEKLKIDQSFVHDIPHDSNDMAIAEAIIALGKALNLKVIAEGVETQAQADFLVQQGCDEAQGYLFSRPEPAAIVAGFPYGDT